MDARQAIQGGPDCGRDHSWVDAHLREHGWDHAFRLLEQGEQDVFRKDFGVARPLSGLTGREDRFLRLFRIAVDVHDRRASAGSSAFNASYRRRSSGDKLVGTLISTVAYKSPRSSGLPTVGMPWPRSRNTRPELVPSGTFRRKLD